ncbi:hypothetical protein PROFUN_13388 [Planoprotostelium fungivorum]|uniref:Uncharacterized protein n=1 Tax=Planoprotostelium fungivorum TaxID=1890364 RepID=A0A2P6MZQ7_9EUKA|nr:hypothetical protein PROFUN_13388 [Planoprotostelium fungivorum]
MEYFFYGFPFFGAGTFSGVSSCVFTNHPPIVVSLGVLIERIRPGFIPLDFLGGCIKSVDV